MSPTGPDRPVIGKADDDDDAVNAIRVEVENNEAAGCEVLDVPELELEGSDFTAEALEPASTRSLRVFVNAPTTRTTAAYIKVKRSMCKYLFR